VFLEMAEAVRLNKSSVRYVLFGALVVAVLVWWRLSLRPQAAVTSAPIVEKRPVIVARHTFDPVAQPAEMPPLVAPETAECDTDFISNASVSGRSKKLDSTHAEVTVTGVKVTLELKINIWVPEGATQQVKEHEEGHRQISEYSYRDADKVAEKVAAEQISKKLSVSGSDLNTEINAALQKIGAEITADYNRRLNPNAVQQRYDDITDHSRYDIAASDAVARVLKEK
jgi:hypothetical protein